MLTPESDQKEVVSFSHTQWVSGGLLEFKELEGDLIVSGYVATTHIDSVGDKVLKETLESWAKEINDGLPRATRVTFHHKQGPRIVGKAIPGSAKVIPFKDGESGLFVDGKLNKVHPDFSVVDYEVKNNFADSFSIEYATRYADGTAIPGAVSEATLAGRQVRLLHPATEFNGYTLASSPINTNCIRVKELLSEVKTMSEQSTVVEAVAVPPVNLEMKEAQAKLDQRQKELEAKEVEFSTRRADLEAKEVAAKVAALPSSKPVLNAEQKEQPKMNIEFKEFQEAVSNGKTALDLQFSKAAALAIKENLFVDGMMKSTKPVESREYKNFQVNGGRLEFKGLSIGSNINSAYVNATSTIGLAQAELQDIFDPTIYNALNEFTAFYNTIAKDNKSSIGSNRVGFILKIGSNASAGAYLGNAISANITLREKYVTQFKKYSCGFAVDGDLIAAARGSPQVQGDVLGQEIQDATLALKTAINTDLFTEQGLETVAKIIGLRFITKSASNTTLYGTTRSSANKLAPASAGSTYVNSSGTLSKALMRAAIAFVLTDGSQLQNLMWVCDFTTRDRIKELFDNSLRLDGPTATRFGFETPLWFEGVPVLGDKDCPSGSLFLVDMYHHRMAVWVPPTVEMLGQRDDSREGFVKTYFAIYNTAPRRMVEIYGIN